MKTLKSQQCQFLFLFSTASKTQSSRLTHLLILLFHHTKSYRYLSKHKTQNIASTYPRRSLQNQPSHSASLPLQPPNDRNPANYHGTSHQPSAESQSGLCIHSRPFPHSAARLETTHAGMPLLTRLTHIPQAHPHLTPVCTMLIASYLKKGRPKDAFKVYKWMLRPGPPCMVEKAAYGILVGGLCSSGLVLEGLMVLGDMLELEVPLLPGNGLRKRVVRSLLREARVKEAMAFQELLPCIEFGCVGGVEGLHKVLDLLDHLIGNWKD